MKISGSEWERMGEKDPRKMATQIAGVRAVVTFLIDVQFCLGNDWTAIASESKIDKFLAAAAKHCRKTEHSS